MKINFPKNMKSGFTLIELLVVVAIISILTAVVLVSLSSARGKGADASVKTNLNTIRGVSELFYNNNSSSFLPSGGSPVAIGICPTYSPVATNMLAKDKAIADAIADAVNRGGNGSSCYNSGIAWAVAVGLKTSATASWCVDSSGASRRVAFAPGSAINGTMCF